MTTQAPSTDRSATADVTGLAAVLDETFGVWRDAARAFQFAPDSRETGTVTFAGQGIARIEGLPGAKADELIRFAGETQGVVFNLDEREVGVVLLDEGLRLHAGSEARRTGRVLDTPVGESLLGRVIDPLGQPLDDRSPLREVARWPIERPSPGIMARAPVTVPLQTGLKVVDALVPVGRGQRELILGDRQTGKTALAVDAMINQRHQNVICIYCAIGQRNSAVAGVVAELREHNAIDYCVVVAATAEKSPGLQFVAPYAATSIGEFFMEQGRDVLVVYDDLTRHARAYRELSLLLRRPPGREAYPGDIFYIHSRLLERATHLNARHGGGSLTALPIAETEAQNVSAYIPTNLISITDGQIYLSPELFQKAILPAVDVGKSVSRVGGKTQLAAYRAVAGDLGLAYSQFEELETFARFGTRLDDDTRQTLERGQRVREVLKQPQFAPMSVADQIAVLLTVTSGLLDSVPLDQIGSAERAVRRAVADRLPEIARRIAAGDRLRDEDRAAVLDTAKSAINEWLGTDSHADA